MILHGGWIGEGEELWGTAKGKNYMGNRQGEQEGWRIDVNEFININRMKIS